jgi:hypothetical protein
MCGVGVDFESLFVCELLTYFDFFFVSNKNYVYVYVRNICGCESSHEVVIKSLTVVYSQCDIQTAIHSTLYASIGPTST